MKIAGWICLVVGLLSFLGAASKGDSVIGPSFLIGLGVYFLYRVNNKEQGSDKKPVKTQQQSKGINEKKEDVIECIPENKQDGILNMPKSQEESIGDIQAQLILEQREAAMCLISFFGGYNNDLMDDAPIMIFKQAAVFFGIPDSPVALSKIMSKYMDADTLADIVLTIKPVKAKEFLLLTCYDLIKTSGNQEAYDLLSNIANDLGYARPRFEQLIRLYK